MNVAFLVSHWGRRGGTSGQCHLAATELVARGHRVTVYAASESAAAGGVDVVPVPGRRGWGAAAWSAGLQRASSGGHQVVVSWVRAPGTPVWRAGGGTHSASVRARDGEGGWRSRLDPRDRGQLAADRACQAAPVVVANSRKCAAELVHDGVDGARVRLVRNGVDLDRFRPGRGLEPRGRVALFLGHGFRRKGLDVAIAAFERVGGAHDQLWVAGHDAHAARWRRKAMARLGARIRWLGAVSNVGELLADVDVLLHPTRYDSSANAVLEAMASGVAPVTTRSDGASEIVPCEQVIAESAEDVDGVARALGYALEVRQPSRWREAASDWPGSRMATGLETLLMEWLDARPR